MGPGVSELRPDPALLPDPDPDAAVAAGDGDEAALREAIRNQHYERYRTQAGKGCLGPVAVLVFVVPALLHVLLAVPR